MGKSEDEKWIGVDFDGTLAVDIGPHQEDPREQPPVELMLKRVQDWLAEGKDVRLVTARVTHGDLPPGEVPEMDQQQVEWLEEWMTKYLGQTIPIQFWKDHNMKEFWDDRAVQVFKNTGVRVDSFVWR